MERSAPRRYPLRPAESPPVHAPNLFQLSAARWAAFWAYEREGGSAHHEIFAREFGAVPLDEPARLAAQLPLARNDRWDAATPPSLFTRLGAFPLAAGRADTALQLALT